MSSRGMRTIATGAVLGLAAAAVGLGAVQPGDYRVNHQDVLLPAESPVATSAKCPRRHRVVPGGAFVHSPGVRKPDPVLAQNAQVPNSAPANGLAGWAAAAHKGPGEDLRLRVVALCAPRGQVRGADVVHERFTVDSGDAGGGHVDCPGATRILTGGVRWHESGSQVPTSAQVRTSSSIPSADRRGWYGDGHNFSGVDLRLDVVAVCLPKRRLSGVTRQSKDVPFPEYGQGFGRNVKCPRGSSVMTGGASWHPAGVPPTPDQAFGTLISSSVPTTNARRWYANGVNVIGPADAHLRIVALCTSG